MNVCGLKAKRRKSFKKRGANHLQSSAAADSSKMNENLPLDITVERFWSLTGMDLKEKIEEKLEI